MFLEFSVHDSCKEGYVQAGKQEFFYLTQTVEGYTLNLRHYLSYPYRSLYWMQQRTVQEKRGCLAWHCIDLRKCTSLPPYMSSSTPIFIPTFVYNILTCIGPVCYCLQQRQLLPGRLLGLHICFPLSSC